MYVKIVKTVKIIIDCKAFSITVYIIPSLTQIFIDVHYFCTSSSHAYITKLQYPS